MTLNHQRLRLNHLYEIWYEGHANRTKFLTHYENEGHKDTWEGRNIGMRDVFLHKGTQQGPTIKQTTATYH